MRADRGAASLWHGPGAEDTVIDAWRWLPALALFSLVGVALERLLGLRPAGAPHWARLAQRALMGLLAVYALTLHPLVLLVLMGGGSAFARGTSATRAPAAPVGRTAPWVLGAAALLLVLHPATPMYWDEFVWLAKARLEAHAPGTLRNAALDPAAGVIPAGYPLFASLSAAWLGLVRDAPGALLAGAGALRLLALAHALFAARSVLGARRGALAPLALLALAPLVLVHWRAAYVDLPVGLFAAALALGLAARAEAPAGERAPTDASCVLCALALVGMKDEGAAHVAAIAAAAALVALWQRRAPTARLAGVALAMAAVPFLAWRVLTHARGVVDTDHTIGRPVLSLAPALGRTLLAHALDLVSWGAFWPAVLGAVVVAAWRGRAGSPAARLVLLAAGAQSAALALGVLCGPEQVQAFALDGTLVNRLLIQLAPTAAVLLALAVRDARAGQTASKSLASARASTMLSSIEQ